MDNKELMGKLESETKDFKSDEDIDAYGFLEEECARIPTVEDINRVEMQLRASILLSKEGSPIYEPGDRAVFLSMFILAKQTREALKALQSQNTYNPETHVVIPKKFNDRQLKRIAYELDQSGNNINYPAQIRIIKSVILKVSADKAITSKGE